MLDNVIVVNGKATDMAVWVRKAARKTKMESWLSNVICSCTNNDSASVVQDCTSPDLGRSNQQCRGDDKTRHETRTCPNILPVSAQPLDTQYLLHLIDGTSFGRYFKSITMAKRIKVAKYVHD